MNEIGGWLGEKLGSNPIIDTMARHADRVINGTQNTLTAASFVPGLGKVADVASAAISAADGDYKEAGMMAVGGAAGKLAAKASKVMNAADGAADVKKIIQEGSQQMQKNGNEIAGASAQATKKGSEAAADAAKTPIHEGTERAWKDGADPNSVYVQKTADGKVKSVSYYDDNGVQFSREDYIQKASHKVTIDGKKVDLKNTPHEHQTRTIEGPKGPYQKNQVRTLDSNGKPTSGWTNEKD